MLSHLIIVILGGLLARIDGWGGGNSKWGKFIAEHGSVWVCGGVFGLMFATKDLWLGPIAAAAFIAWRLPGFNKWENPINMLWRGMWTSAIGFGLLSIYTGFSQPLLLAALMGGAQALFYSGTYKHLRGRIADPWLHVVAEVGSGLAYTTLFLRGAI